MTQDRETEQKRTKSADNGGTDKAEGVSGLDMTVEEIFAAIDGLIDELEAGTGSLEDAFLKYEQGVRLVKECSGKIDRIEKQVLVLNGEREAEDGADV